MTETEMQGLQRRFKTFFESRRGSAEEIVVMLRRHPEFAGIHRATIYRWVAGVGKIRAARYIERALEILENLSVKSLAPSHKERVKIALDELTGIVELSLALQKAAKRAVRALKRIN